MVKFVLVRLALQVYMVIWFSYGRLSSVMNSCECIIIEIGIFRHAPGIEDAVALMQTRQKVAVRKKLHSWDVHGNSRHGSLLGRSLNGQANSVSSTVGCVAELSQPENGTGVCQTVHEGDLDISTLKSMAECQHTCMASEICAAMDWYEKGSDKRCHIAKTKSAHGFESDDFISSEHCSYWIVSLNSSACESANHVAGQIYDTDSSGALEEAEAQRYLDELAASLGNHTIKRDPLLTIKNLLTNFKARDNDKSLFLNRTEAPDDYFAKYDVNNDDIITVPEMLAKFS